MNPDSLFHEQRAQQASDFVKAIFGWQRSPSDVVTAASMFRTGWIHDALERRKTRGLAMNIMRNTVSQNWSQLHCPDN